jgi:hypothetical protein
MLLRHHWKVSRISYLLSFASISFTRYHVHNDRLDLFGGLGFIFRISLHHETTAASYLHLIASLLAALFYRLFFPECFFRVQLKQDVTAAHSDASSLTAKK